MSAWSISGGLSGKDFWDSSGNRPLTRNHTCINQRKMTWVKMGIHMAAMFHVCITNLNSWRWMSNQAKLLPAWCLVWKMEKIAACPWWDLLLMSCTLAFLECDNFHSILVASIHHQMQTWSNRCGIVDTQVPAWNQTRMRRAFMSFHMGQGNKWKTQLTHISTFSLITSLRSKSHIWNKNKSCKWIKKKDLIVNYL